MRIPSLLYVAPLLLIGAGLEAQQRPANAPAAAPTREQQEERSNDPRVAPARREGDGPFTRLVIRCATVIDAAGKTVMRAGR